MRVATKNINAVVSDFAKLNYLLSDKKVTIQPSQVATIPPTPIEVEPMVKSQKEVLEENISLMKDLLEFVTEKSERKVIIENIKQIKEILKFV
jgi:protein subunit release factor A